MASIGQLAMQLAKDIGKAQRKSKALTPGGHKPACWPMVSYNLGCHPSQIKEVKKILRRAGTDAEFTKDGKCVVTSAGQRKRVAAALGMFDYNAGYGDPGPQQIHYDMQRRKLLERHERLEGYKQIIGHMSRQQN